MTDGARTRDIRDHNAMLYLLSYSHHGWCAGKCRGRRWPGSARIGGKWTGRDVIGKVPAMLGVKSFGIIGAVLGVALVSAGCSSGSSAKAAPDAVTTTIAPGATTGPNAPSTSSTPLRPVPAASPGCGKAPAVTAGESKVDMTSGGAARWYFRHVPSSYQTTVPMPVVVDLHGYQEGATIHEVMSGLGPFGETHHFITVTPQGSGNPVARWDTALDSPDTKFIGDLLDEVEATLCVDPHRVFVAGLSNGAFMTSSMACKYADRFAAAAPVAGVISNVKNCKPARAVPLITFHGTADGFVAYDGGLGKAALNLPSPDGKGKLGDNPAILKQRKGLSIPQQVAGWAKRNGCGTPATETKVANDVTRFTYPCPNHADVVFYRVTGGGHTWPGSAFSKVIAGTVGYTTFSINADELMWKFFTQHPLP